MIQHHLMACLLQRNTNEDNPEFHGGPGQQQQFKETSHLFVSFPLACFKKPRLKEILGTNHLHLFVKKIEGASSVLAWPSPYMAPLHHWPSNPTKEKNHGQRTKTNHQSHCIWILQSTSDKGNHGSSFCHYSLYFIIRCILFCIGVINLNILIVRCIHDVILHVSALCSFFLLNSISLYGHTAFIFPFTYR